jgi:hypothetical protein
MLHETIFIDEFPRNKVWAKKWLRVLEWPSQENGLSWAFQNLKIMLNISSSNTTMFHEKSLAACNITLN